MHTVPHERTKSAIIILGQQETSDKRMTITDIAKSIYTENTLNYKPYGER